MGDVAGWVYLLTALFVTFDIVSRRLFGFSSQGTVEISGYLLGFGITWGLSYTLATKGHIRVDVLVQRLPVGLRAYLHGLALLFLTALALLFARRAWDVVLESWEFQAKDVSALAIPLVLVQAPWAIGLTVFAVLTTLMLLETVLMLLLGYQDLVDERLGSRTLEQETEGALEAAGVRPAGLRAEDADLTGPRRGGAA
jgi:TRAP-type C4-dicarboxylate transport system permease small subunit